MKKILLSILSLLMAVSSFATDVWTGSHAVTWGTPLNLEASNFSADATKPMELVVTYENASDGIEFKRMDNWEQVYFDNSQPISGNGQISKVLTVEALRILSSTGLQIIGSNFTVTKVELNETELSEGNLWKGFFWMDSWNTLTLKGDYYKDVDWNNVKAIRFYSEAKHNDENRYYVINVLTKFDVADAKLGDQNTMTMTKEYAELSLDGIDMNEKLSYGNLMVQCNKESGDAFNFTSIELVLKDNFTVSTAAEIGEGEYVSTFFCAGTTVLPAGVEAYTASVNGENMTLNKIDSNVIPAGKGVLLLNNDNTSFEIARSTYITTSGVENAFIGTETAITGSDLKAANTGKKLYVLSKKEDVVGFYALGDATNVGANKAVLAVDASSSAKSFRISFENGEVSAIKNVSESVSVNENAYNAMGQRVARDAKGLVIVYGKKMFNK